MSDAAQAFEVPFWLPLCAVVYLVCLFSTTVFLQNSGSIEMRFLFSSFETSVSCMFMVSFGAG